MSEMIQRISKIIKDHNPDFCGDPYYLSRYILESILQPTVLMIDVGNSSAETVNADVVYIAMMREALREKQG